MMTTPTPIESSPTSFSVVGARLSAENSREPRPVNRGPERFLPLLVFACVALAGLHAMSPFPVGVFQDDGIYVVLAKALATGEGYRYLHLPGEPAATHYPPGYPALLALLWKLSPEFPQNLALFKLVNVALAAAGCAFAFRFVERRLGLPTAAAAAVAIVSGVGIPTLVTAGLVLSEPLFLAVLFPALILAEQLADPGARPTIRRAIAVGVLCGVVVLVRTIAVVLVPAVLLAMAWSGRARLREIARTLLAFGAGALLVLLPWQVYKARHAAVLPDPLQGKYGSYGGWLAEGFRQDGPAFGARVLWRNLHELGWMSEMLFAINAPRAWRLVAAATVLVLFVLGLARALRRAPVSALFTLGYMGIVVLWPFAPARFVCAIWPLVLGIVSLGALEVWRWRPAWRGGTPVRLAALAVVALTMIGQSSYLYVGYRGKYWDSIAKVRAPDAIAAAEWVARNTAPSHIVATEEETMVWLYTGRQAVPVTAFTAREYLRQRTTPELATDLRRIVSAYRPHWVLIGSRPGQIAAEALQVATPPVLRPVGYLPDEHLIIYVPTPR